MTFLTLSHSYSHKIYQRFLLFCLRSTTDPSPITAHCSITTPQIVLDRQSDHQHFIAITLVPLCIVAMSDSESEDDLRPHELGRRQFEPSFFSVSDDEPEVRDYDSDSCSAATSTCSSPDGITSPMDVSIEDLGDAAINQFRSSQGGVKMSKSRPRTPIFGTWYPRSILTIYPPPEPVDQ